MSSIADEIGKMTNMLTADSNEVSNDPEPEDDNTEVIPDSDPAPDLTPEVDLDPEPKPEPVSEEDPEPDEEEDPEPAPDELALAKARIVELEAAAKREPEAKPDPEPEPEPTPDPVAEQDFLANLDLDDVTRNPDQFNKLLNLIYTKSIEAARIEGRSSQEATLKSIPEIVKSNITLVTTLKKASEEFYDEHKDLQPFKKTVAAVFEELASANPDKKYTDLFKELAPDVRKRLGLEKKAKETVKEKPDKKSSLPSNKGNSRRTVRQPETTGLVSELDAMNKSLMEE